MTYVSYSSERPDSIRPVPIAQISDTRVPEPLAIVVVNGTGNWWRWVGRITLPTETLCNDFQSSKLEVVSQKNLAKWAKRPMVYWGAVEEKCWSDESSKSTVHCLTCPKDMVAHHLAKF